MDAYLLDQIPVGTGPISTGGSLIFGNVLGGTLTSEPGVSNSEASAMPDIRPYKCPQFETQINSSLLTGTDFPIVDPDGLRARPNFRGVVLTDDNEYIQVLFTGIQTTTPELSAVVSGTGTGNLPFGSFQSGRLILLVSVRGT